MAISPIQLFGDLILSGIVKLGYAGAPSASEAGAGAVRYSSASLSLSDGSAWTKLALSLEATLETTTSTADQTLLAVASATTRSIWATIAVTSGSNAHSTKVHVTYDGSNVYIEQSEDLRTGPALATFDASVSGGNLLLTTTPVNAVTSYRVKYTLVES